MPTMPMRLTCSSKGHASRRPAGSSRSSSLSAMSVWRAREAKTAATYGSARWASQLEIRSRRPCRARWRRARAVRADLSAPRWTGACAVLRADAIRQGRRPCRADPADLAGQSHRPRHQGRELDPDVGLSRPARPRAAVRSDQCGSRRLQSAARSAARRMGSPRRPECRRHAGRSRRARWSGAITGRRPATRCWSAPSCTSSMPEQDKTLAGVASFLSDPKRPIETTLRAMMTTPHLGEAGPHPVIASAARELLNKSENERSGVLSTAMSFLGLYRDPVVAKVTRRCDWRIARSRRERSARRRSISSCRRPTSAAPSRWCA